MPRCAYCKDFIPLAKSLSNHQSKSKKCLELRARARAEIARHVNDNRYVSTQLNGHDSNYSSAPDSNPTSFLDLDGFENPNSTPTTVTVHQINVTAPEFDQDAVPPDPQDIRDQSNKPPQHEGVWDEAFPPDKRAGASIGPGKTNFETYRDKQIREGAEILGPFENDAEWELAKWLMKNVGHSQAEEFLKLPIVRTCVILHKTYRFSYDAVSA